MTRRGPSRTSTRIDPWALAVGVVALAVIALHGVQGELVRDVGLYSYAGQQFADGVPPYVGLLNRAGPLAHVLPGVGALLARLAGADDLLGMRVLFMVVGASCISVTYVVGRDLFRSRAAGVAAAAALLSMHGFIELAAYGPREKTPLVLFILCAFWATIRRRWFAAGVFVSLATLVLQIGFFTAFPAALVGALVAARNGRARALVLVAAGGLTPVVVIVAYFAAVGALRELVDGFALVNARYTGANPLLGRVPQAWTTLERGFGESRWVVVVGLVAILVLSLLALRRSGRLEGEPTSLVPAFGVAMITAMAWTWRDYDSWRDVFPLLPLAALGIGGLAHLLTQSLSATATRAAIAAWLAVAATTAILFSVGERDDRLLAQRQSVDAMLRVLPADASILSIQAPQSLVLSGKTNATRHQMFANGLLGHLEDTWPGGVAGFVKESRGDTPELVAVGNVRGRWWRGITDPGYEKVGRAPGWAWYARESLGAGVLSELRAAGKPRSARPVT